MINVFIGSSYNNIPTGELKKYQVENFRDFCSKYLSTCIKGMKNEHYVTIGNRYSITPANPKKDPRSYHAKDHYHRNNESQVSAWLLPLDGDSSRQKEGHCIPPIAVHNSLRDLRYNHVIYTTHSHVKETKNRWRLFLPCKISSKDYLPPTVDYLFKLLSQNGCINLAMSSESKTWSSPWFLPTRSDPEDGHFEYYEYFDGRDFLAIEHSQETKIEVSTTDRTIYSMLETVEKGIANTGLHAATRDLAYGLVKDGLAPGAVKSVLHFITKNYSKSNKRQFENKNKIDALVDSSTKKVITESPEWQMPAEATDVRAFTNYPNQKNMMEELIQACLRWMPYPNRQIAVVAAHTLVSTLGGRTYTLKSGSGIVLTALVTGRSTIGKSFIKKFCIHALNSFQLANVSQDFIGSHFYTSSKNLIDELRESGSLLSVRTESGQSDKSTAGDMTRVLMYELELATESGRNGYVSSGGQNEKIPSLFSPAVTTIRESVAQIQNEADIINATSISGVAGRRSHVLIDPVKGKYNEFPETELPANIKNLLLTIYKKAANENRRKVTDPLPPLLWTEVKYKNPQYLSGKRRKWLEKENKAAIKNMHFESTFYGRLGERLPSWAARLAICDNPNNPEITNQHINIAESSLIAELKANNVQQDSGELDTDAVQTAKFIVSLFKGDMTKQRSLKSDKNYRMLKEGACELHKIMNRARAKASYKRAAIRTANMDAILIQIVKTMGIIELPKDESRQKYGYAGRVLKRV